MADFNNDQLLLALGIDLTPLKNAAAQAESILDALEAHWNKVSKQQVTGTVQQAQAATAVSAAQQKVKDTVAQVVHETQSAVEATKQQASHAQLNVDILHQQINEAVLATKQAERQTAQYKMQTAALQQQTAELRKQRAERAGEAHESGGGAATARLTTAFAKGALGENVFGEVAAGVLAGEGIASAIEGASHALQEFITHLREISVESGSVVQLQAVFNRMAQTLGTSGNQLLGGLQHSTEGLADNFTLMRTGLMALTSSYQISVPVLQQFLHDTVNVAEASGVSATHALDALRQSFTLGRPQTLSAALAMESLRNETSKLPPIFQGAAKTAAEWNLIMREVHNRAVAFGELPPTLEKTAEQFEVIKRNLDLAFGTGFNQSSGILQFTRALDQLSSKESQLSKDVQQFGGMMGNVLGFVTEAVSKLLNVMSSVPVQFVAWAAGAGTVGLFATAALGAVRSITKFALAQAEADEATTAATESEVANIGVMEGEAGAANAAAAALERKGVAAGEAGLAARGLGGAVRGVLSPITTLKLVLGDIGTMATGASVALVPLGLVLAALGLNIEMVRSKSEGMFGALPTLAETWRGSLDQMKQNWDDIWRFMGDDLEALIHGRLGQLMNQVGAQVGNFAPGTQQHQTAANIAGEQHKDKVQTSANKAQGAVEYEKAKNEAQSAAAESGKATAKANQAYLTMMTAKGKSAMAQATELFNKANLAAEAAAKKAGEANTLMRQKAVAAGINQEALANDQQMAAYIKMQQEQAGLLTPQQQSQISRSMAQAMQERAQMELEAKKSTIAQEKEMDDESYAAGEETFRQHQQKQAAIGRETLAAQLEENRQQYNSSASAIHAQVANGTMLPAIGAFEVQTAQEKQAKADEAAQLTYNATLSRIRMENVKDAEKAATQEAASVLSIKQKQIQTELALIKKDFEDGQTSANAYMVAQVKAQQDLVNAQISKAAAVYAAGPKNSSTQATYLKVTEDAVASAQARITEIVDHQTDLQLQSIERVYTTQQKTIDAQLAFNKQFGGGLPVGGVNQATLLQTGISSVTAQIQAYEETFTQMNTNGEAFSDNWWKVVDGTEAAMTKLIEYNDQLSATLAMSTPVGNIFTTLGKGIQNSVGNPKAKNAGMVIASAGQQLAQLAQTQQQIARLNKGTKLDPVQQQMLDMSTHVSSTFSGAADSFKSTTGQVETALQQLADAVVQVRNKITGTEAGAHSGTPGGSSGGGGSALTVGSHTLFNEGSGGGNSGLDSNDSNSAAQNIINAQTATSTEAPQFSSVLFSPTAPAMAPPSLPNVSTATDPLAQFAAKLQLAVESLTGFVSTITQAQTPLAGAIGGGISGGSLGSQAQSAMSGMGGGIGQAMQGALGQSMPFIGAAVGMLLGGIMGQKNAQVQEEMQDLKTTFNQMQQALSSGNASLTQTIQQLRELISEATIDMQNSKKGAQQFQDLINQYNQQLTQYLDQQQSLMIKLNESVTQLRLPDFGEYYSQYISSLQQVITQYESYAGAASDAAQQLQAVEFLQKSLAGYAEQWTQQLEQDEVTAVQNALQLNELIVQRNQLLQQTAQNERSIMEQGVLTRQQTFAQSKAQQLAQTQLQASLQLEQMNQQIDVAQAQVSAAQQVFDLATTRIGLEQQLVQLQSAAAGQQMASVQALANLVAALNSGVANNQSALPTQNNFILSLLSMLANNGNNNASSLIGLLQIFQQYSSSGLSSGTVLSTY